MQPSCTFPVADTSDSTTFTLVEAQLVALFLESCIFGAFTVLYAIAIWILVRKDKKRSSRLNIGLFATATFMWVLCVVHLGIDVARAIIGFVRRSDSPTDTCTFFATLSEPTLVVKDAIYTTMTLIADTFVTYRLWIVWSCNWWVAIVPFMLLIAAAIAGYGAIIAIGQSQGESPIFAEALRPWIHSFFSISLTTNILVTLLIAGRIVWSNRQVKQLCADGAVISSRWEVVETLVQSGAIYSFALACLLGTYMANSNAQYVCVDALQPLIGFVFTLIIIRVGLGHMLNESSGNQMVDKYAIGGRIQTIGGTVLPVRSAAVHDTHPPANNRFSLQTVYHIKGDADS